MKTNFKKLAMVAGVTAALAGGSMSAHAVIQAVPAPAALIPLFTTGHDDDVALLRVQVPASVGKDDVAVIFGGPGSQPTGDYVNPNLAGSIADAAKSKTSRIHWIHLDVDSNEINNGEFPVSANDVVEFNSHEMPSTLGSKALSSQPGYLVLVNQSALGGGAPLFSFTAEAFIVAKNDTQYDVAYNIPVFPLTDSADTAVKVPTLFNNVVETYPTKVVGSPYGNGVIVSPLVSGIRTASSEGGVRVVDLPVYEVNGKSITDYVVWNDRNATYDGLEGGALQTYGLTGPTWLYDKDEGQLSAGTLSLEHQLSMIEIGGGYDGDTDDNNPLFGPTPHVHIFEGEELSKLGFVRWAIQPGVNYGNVTGAYAAAVIFRLPINPIPSVNVAYSWDKVGKYVSPVNDGYSVFPLDRGFFSSTPTK